MNTQISLARFFAPGVPSLSTVLKATLTLAAVRRQRAQLRTLDAHLLSDIGITREQAEKEAKKPFWNAPDHWLR